MKNELTQEEIDKIIESVTNVLEPALQLAYVKGQADAIKNEKYIFNNR